MSIQLYDLVAVYVMLSVILMTVAIVVLQAPMLALLTFMTTIAGIVYLQIRDSLNRLELNSSETQT